MKLTKRLLLSGVLLLLILTSTVSEVSSQTRTVRLPGSLLEDLDPPKYIPGWDGIPAENLVLERITPPPDEAVRWTAQWEPRAGVLLAWPLYWPDVTTTFCGMVDELQDVGAVYMLYNNKFDQLRIIRKLSKCGVPLDNIQWLDISYDTNWIRDYGPQNIWGQDSGNWGIVDNVYLWRWKDNAVNGNLSDIWGSDFYATTIQTEGGNMLGDGMGRLFATDWILQENPGKTEQRVRELFSNYMNVELTILPQPPVSPHLDMTAKIVDPETWIVGEWPPDDPNTPFADEIVQTLESMTASTGNPYTIYRVQQPDRLPGGYWRTYTNTYMQNGVVLVPTYGVEQDDAALAVFQAALPDWEVVGIDSTGFDGSGGAIHCSTHGIASQEIVDLLEEMYGR